MIDTTFNKAQRLAAQLTPREQARLLAYLANQLAQVVPATSPEKDTVVETMDAWERFFNIGDSLVATDASEGETLTATVLDMRR